MQFSLTYILTGVVEGSNSPHFLVDVSFITERVKSIIEEHLCKPYEDV